MKNLSLHTKGLFLPMKTTFRQASSIRSAGESVWVLARRAAHIGVGEGCPRKYVTGEQVADCIVWLKQQFPLLEKECGSLEQLQRWVYDQRSVLDKHPAAWCAAETALLDLLAREAGKSVESLLGKAGPEARYYYTAILSDDKEADYQRMLNAYLGAGFSNYKIKIGGRLKNDRGKLELLQKAWAGSNMRASKPAIRLDANNLWKGKTDQAIKYLKQLGDAFWAIEEPVAPKAIDELSRISLATGKAIILDESLCTMDDLNRFKDLPGQFVANIKISRVGGVLRALELVEAIKAFDWKIIIGAHVAETSIMTRAGMLVARAAGEQLIGQEGGYGTMLLEREPVAPSLVFGYGGIIDLTKNNDQGMYAENWQLGWGLSPIIVRD